MSSLGDATSQYAPDIEAAVLANGYAANVVSIDGRRGLRASQRSYSASIWARDSVAMANGSRALADAYPGRFVLGIGVSHESSVDRRGHLYRQPLSHMRTYLNAMEKAPHACPDPDHHHSRGR